MPTRLVGKVAVEKEEHETLEEEFLIELAINDIIKEEEVSLCLSRPPSAAADIFNLRIPVFNGVLLFSPAILCLYAESWCCKVKTLTLR